jgi:hypothetical protein
MRTPYLKLIQLLSKLVKVEMFEHISVFNLLKLFLFKILWQTFALNSGTSASLLVKFVMKLGKKFEN